MIKVFKINSNFKIWEIANSARKPIEKKITPQINKTKFNPTYKSESSTKFKKLNDSSLQSVIKKNKLKKDGEKRKKKKNINIQANNGSRDSLIFENFEEIPKGMTSQEIGFILNSLKSNFLFTNLNDSEFEEIISNMFFAKIRKDSYIFKQNSKATCFFVIQEGKFSVEINGEEKKVLGKGSSFGELALLYNAPRSAALKAKEDCSVWGIQRNIFKSVLQEMNNKEKSDNMKIINQIAFLEEMTDSQKESLSVNIITLRYYPGEVIVNKGDQADSYYLIKTGTVGCYDGDKFVRELNEGDSFGEQALYKNGHRSLTVKAKDKVECLAISRETLLKVFGSDIETILSKNTQNWAIENSEIFNKLNKLQVYKWINNSVFKVCSLETTLESIGNKLENIYIVNEGSLSYGEKVVKKGQIFGGEFIFPHDQDRILTEDLIATNCKYSVISINDLFRSLGEDRLELVFKSNKEANKRKRRNTLMMFRTNVQTLKLEDLLYLKNIGEGQFGDVYMVSEKNSIKKKYALKAICREKIIQHNIEGNLINEKKVLQKINFPLITRMFNFYKDKYAAYFLLNLIQGLDMFDMIRQIDLLDNDESKFYVGSILLCLEYLHGQQIIYRDLKPENTMIDKKGYLHLIDLGTAKIMDKGESRTYTILGTPHYMAPEIIQGKGYSYAVDLWALGICVFEFMCGFVPFGEEEEDPFEIYRLIISSSFKYPSYFLTAENQDAKEFIDILLNRIPEARINGSYAGLKGHKWFEDFDWNGIFEKSVDPPYRPPQNSSISEEDIKAMFDKSQDLEEFLSNKYKDQKVRRSINKNVEDWESEFDEGIFLKQTLLRPVN